MNSILELREKRAKAWEATKAFLDSHRNDKGVLSAEDDAAYTRMEQEITDLKRKVEESYHNELAAAMEREVDKLVQDAANEAQRLAEEAASAERDAMRQRLRDMLLNGATV